MNVEASVFLTSSIAPEVAELNSKLTALCQKEFDNNEKWFDIGAEEYRKRRDAGETAFPKPIHNKRAKIIEVPSREEERTIKLRCIVPEGKIKGIFLHIHGGGQVNARNTLI